MTNQTPAQQARDYAAQHGFTIEAIGRRYKVMHAATGTTFERGGYPAVLNEMRMLIVGMENVGIAHPDDMFNVRNMPCSVAPITSAADIASGAFVLKNAAEIVEDIKALQKTARACFMADFQAVGRGLRPFFGWARPWVAHFEGHVPQRFSNRAAAVAYIRYRYNQVMWLYRQSHKDWPKHPKHFRMEVRYEPN